MNEIRKSQHLIGTCSSFRERRSLGGTEAMNLGERARVDGHLLVFFIQALESNDFHFDCPLTIL